MYNKVLLVNKIVVREREESDGHVIVLLFLLAFTLA